jgi:lactoylglutathione lyase
VTQRAFPVVFAKHAETTAGFYELLGFKRHFQLPPEGEPGYIGLRRDTAELAVVDSAWPSDQYGGTVATHAMRFEMFVYVEDVDTTVDKLRATDTPILREPTEMPWGERVAYVADPDGNPVGLAAARSSETGEPAGP